jgi:uncharacterized protein YbjT (DUF2867 family)
MIVVTTPTGHIGSQVVANLLATNRAVRVIVACPSQARRRGPGQSGDRTGSSDDESVLMRVLEGAESLILVVRFRLGRTM